MEEQPPAAAAHLPHLDSLAPGERSTRVPGVVPPISGARARWAAAAAALLAALVGCSGDDRPPLGAVEGVVTLDGAPLADATVVFQPEQGRASRGRTDQQGHYELVYLRDVRGAVVGRHTVAITTATELSPTERLPACYNAQTRLKQEVKPGANQIDFPLQSVP